MRVVLKMHDEHERFRYWRVPRPRPRPHRRQVRTMVRRRQQQIVKAALFGDQPPTTTSAEEVIKVLQASLQNLLRRAESAKKELLISRDQLRQLRDAAQPPVELDLRIYVYTHAYICSRSVQQLQGVDQAPQATQPITGRRPVCTQPGPDRKQPPPRQKAHFVLDHRATVCTWSPFRTGGALRAPTEETKAGRQEEKDEDRAATARCLLQNLMLNSAILDFEARSSKIKSKLSKLVDTWDSTLDHRRVAPIP